MLDDQVFGDINRALGSIGEAYKKVSTGTDSNAFDILEEILIPEPELGDDPIGLNILPEDIGLINLTLKKVKEEENQELERNTLETGNISDEFEEDNGADLLEDSNEEILLDCQIKED